MSSQNHRMLELSMKILEAVATNPEGMSVSDVYSSFGIPKSSASTLLRTFQNMGYMMRDKAGVFHIGPKAFQVGTRFAENDEGYTYAGLILDDLVSEVGETAHLGILNDAEVMYVCKSECSHAVRMISQVGKLIPAHATAVGKALLSVKTDDEVRKLYKDKPLVKLTQHTITDIDQLIEQLHQIRYTGFATEREESTEGVSCIATPLCEKTRGNPAAISIAIPLIRLGNGHARFKEPLLSARDKIKVVL